MREEAPTVALSAPQRELLGLLRAQARVWETPRGYQLISPLSPWSDLTESTVKSLIEQGYLQRVESYGVDRSVWALTEVGKLRAAEVQR